MYLYRVARYGNEEEGADGDDTNFLIHADSLETAISLADNYLKLLPYGNKIEPFSNIVIEFAHIEHEDEDSRIIMGPSYEPCIQYLRKKSWYRGSKEEKWEEESI